MAAMKIKYFGIRVLGFFLFFTCILYVLRRPILEQVYVFSYTYSKWNTVEKLIRKDIDVNKKNSLKYNVLYYASHTAPLNTIERLVQSGADYKESGSKVRPPVLISAELGRWEVVSYYFEVDSETPVFFLEKLFINSIRQRQITIASKLISKGVSVNIYSTDGLTPLHHVLQSQYFNADLDATMKIMTLLIENGANINALSKPQINISDSHVGRRGSPKPPFPKIRMPLTPLDMALLLKEDDIISLLQEHGAKASGLNLNSEDN